MLRVIREIKPSFIVGENVAGLVSMDNGKTLDGILSDLANEGYTIEQFIIPALAITANHRRDRIWIIGYISNPECNGWDRYRGIKKIIETRREAFSLSYSCIEAIQNKKIPEFNRKHNGLSAELDKDRIKGLGNAIVPQVAFQIFKAIEEFVLEINKA